MGRRRGHIESRVVDPSLMYRPVAMPTRSAVVAMEAN